MVSPAVLVVVAGQAGAGRTRLGAIVAERTGARRLEMNEMLAGEEDRLPEEAEYGSLLSVATASLRGGRSVVAVGPFHTLESRKKVLRAASESQSALLFVECSANESVRRRRLRDEMVAAQKAPVLEKRISKRIALDDEYVALGDEVPRACQMLIDTTVGLSLWGALAASRVEGYLTAGIRVLDVKALSAG